MKTKLAVFDFDDTIIDRSLESKEFFALSKLFSNQELAQEFLENVKNQSISWSDQWKTFNESTNVTKEDIYKAIDKFEAAGIQICALTADQGVYTVIIIQKTTFLRGKYFAERAGICLGHFWSAWGQNS